MYYVIDMALSGLWEIPRVCSLRPRGEAELSKWTNLSDIPINHDSLELVLTHQSAIVRGI